MNKPVNSLGIISNQDNKKRLGRRRKNTDNSKLNFSIDSRSKDKISYNNNQNYLKTPSYSINYSQGESMPLSLTDNNNYNLKNRGESNLEPEYDFIYKSLNLGINNRKLSENSRELSYDNNYNLKKASVNEDVVKNKKIFTITKVNKKDKILEKIKKERYLQMNKSNSPQLLALPLKEANKSSDYLNGVTSNNKNDINMRKLPLKV